MAADQSAWHPGLYTSLTQLTAIREAEPLGACRQ